MAVRDVLKAVSWISFGNVVVRALSIATMPILTRHLSPDAYGAAALVGTFVSLASVFALSGLDMGYSRHAFSTALGSGAEVEHYCWRRVLLNALVVALIGAIGWHLASRSLHLSSSYSVFVSTGIFFSALMAMSQARARLQSRYARLARIQLVTGVVVAASSVAIAVFWRKDATALLIAMVLGYMLPVILLGMPSIRALREASTLSPSQRRSVVATGLAGIVTAPAYWVLSSSDRWFLAAYHDQALVGVYSIGFAVGTIGSVVSSAVTAAWLPELSRDESSADKSAHHSDRAAMIHLLIAVLLIVGVGVAASGGDVIRALAGPGFHRASAVVPLLAAAVVFYGVMHVGNALLVMKGKLHWAAIAWGIAFIASVGLNWWLVPRYGAHGAALVQALSFLIVMVLVWIAALSFHPLDLAWGRLTVAAGFALLAVIVMSVPWNANPWWSLGVKLPIGMIFGVVCLLVVCPRAVESAFRRLKGMI